jgi:hypothetical protein
MVYYTSKKQSNQQSVQSPLSWKSIWRTDNGNGPKPGDPQSSKKIYWTGLLTPGHDTNMWRGKDNKSVNKNKQLEFLLRIP